MKTYVVFGVAVAIVVSSGIAEGQVCCLAADVNGDLRVDGEDVALFAQALIDPAGMDPRALCAADIIEDGLVDLNDVGPFVDLLLSPSSALFDYGPPWPNTEAEQIALEMLGASGPLLAPDPVYQRIDRDLGLIRATEPTLAGETHSPAWAPNQLIVNLIAGLPLDDYQCLNADYQVINVSNIFGDWYVLTFPGNLNVVALGTIYVAATEVQFTEPNGLLGGQNYWTPTDLGGGVWRWEIDDGWWDCFDGCDCHRYYVYETDTPGNVMRISYQEQGWPWCEF